MKRRRYGFLLMAILLWNFSMAMQSGGKANEEGIDTGQERSFQVEEWEKGLNRHRADDHVAG